MKLYDVVVIGAGPAGLAAGLYASRAKLDTVVLEKKNPGGQIGITNEIANYPGAPEGSSGPTLIARMVEQVKEFGAEIIKDDIISVDFTNKIKVVRGKDAEYQAKTVIITTGCTPRTIGCPGENTYTGKGVSYCATCDGSFFEDMEVYVVGGGDSAVEEAMFLTKFARKITIIQNLADLTAAKSIQKKVHENPKISYVFNSIVEEVRGTDGLLDTIVVRNTATNEVTEFKADEEDMTFGLFVFIGLSPQTDLFNGAVEMDRGYIVTDDNMRTSVDGVFAAGDLRIKSLRQVVTATADGAIAAVMAEKYIDSEF